MLFISLLLVAASVTAEIDFSMFQFPDFKGDELRFSMFNLCTDIVPEFNDQANSVISRGGCALLCKDFGCKGECYKMEAGAPGANDLSSIGFANSISSVKDCYAPPPPPPPPSTAEPTRSVSLYKDSKFQGREVKMDLSTKCSNVPADFNDQLSSMNSRGACVILFKNYNCEGESREMRPGVEGEPWSFLNHGWNDAVSSLRLCTANIDIWANEDFQGKQISAQLNGGGNCFDLPNDFNDLASSVNSHDECIVLFKDFGCKGDSLKLSPSNSAIAKDWTFLGNGGFNDVLSSLKLCTD